MWLTIVLESAKLRIDRLLKRVLGQAKKIFKNIEFRMLESYE